MKNPFGQVKFVHLFKVIVLNLHVIMMKPETKLIISVARLLELMCFKLCQLIYYVCCCYGISVHENNYDSSCRQKQFYAM